MYVHRLATSVVVRAPAKLNLFFELLARRTDGFHEIETLMAPVDLFDTLVAAPLASERIELDCRWAVPASLAPSSVAAGSTAAELGELPPAEKNLAYRAVALLRERAGIDRGISLSLTKRIPSMAGLGGGSSDAAAALLAANEIWQLSWSHAELAEVAAQLGSDIPFFVYGGAAICRGRGELIEPLTVPLALHFVVVRPPVGLSTAAVYQKSEVPALPRHVEPLVAALARGDRRNLGTLIHNQLEGAADRLSPWIERVRREFAAQGCLAMQMSGSGTSYFGICCHARHARRVARRLQSRGIGRVYACRSCN
jgi:4-diphosphocytidyl-2-C-methyl-D-erythritol kinase